MAADPGAWRGALGRVGGSLLDLALPLLVFGYLTVSLHPSLAGHLDSRLGAPDLPNPSDSNGTIWFYWWFAQAFEQGKDLLNPDVVCAPRGQALGSNFPNRMDAWFALPFFRHYPFPRSFNLTLLAVPVAGALAAYILARTRGLGRLVALAVGACFGFGAFTGFELLNGRVASGLLLWYPLFLVPWFLALELGPVAAGIAALAAGVAAAAAVLAYVPVALALLLVALLSALYRVFRPQLGVSRWRPLAVGLVVALVGGVGSAPYAHEILVVRTVEPDVSGTARTTRSAWDPALYRELRQRLQTPTGPSGGQGRRDPDVINDAQPINHLWSPPKGDAGSRAYVPPLLVGAGLLGGLLGGRRGRLALVAMFGAWLLTLGPYALIAQDPAELLRIGGARLVLPTAWILDLLPYASSFLRPYRYTPLLELTAAFAAAFGAQALGGWLGTRLVGRVGPRLGGWAGTLVAATLMVALAAGSVRSVQQAGGYTLLEHPWSPPPGIQMLAEAAPGTVVAELPVGAGHALALYQVAHGKSRTEPHHDLRSAIFDGGTLPQGCYTLALSKLMWGLGRRGQHAAAEAALDEAAIAEALAANIRYVVLYPMVMRMLFPRDTPVDGRGVAAALTRRLGPPVLADDHTWIWEVGGR